MATTDIVPQEAHGQLGQHRVVNDMSIQVATVNGSGSQSSNTVLLRSIFQMGVPVSGKNLFPSNIAGLPTWYTIRANKDGYIARKKEIDFVIAMNAETAQEDVMSVAPGAVVLYDEPLNLNKARTDLVFYPVPFDKLVAPVCPEAKLRKLVKNMIYVGVAAQLLGIDMAEVEKALRKQFATKVKAANLNLAAVRAATAQHGDGGVGQFWATAGASLRLSGLWLLHSPPGDTRESRARRVSAKAGPTPRGHACGGG